MAEGRAADNHRRGRRFRLSWASASMSGTAETLFNAANEQYQAALKWRYLTILILAFLHVFIVKPYVELGRAKEKAEAELKYGTEQARRAAELTLRLDQHRQRIAERVTERTGAVRDNLVCAFEELNQAIRVARGEAPPPLPSAALRPPQAQMNLAAPGLNLAPPSPIQAPLDLQRVRPGQVSLGCSTGMVLPPFDPPQLEAVRRAQSADDLAHGLHPYIERYVVLPPLQAFNAEWRDGDAPPLIAAVADIRVEIAAAKARPGPSTPERDAIWRALEKAPGEIEAALRTISIPESAAGDDWWRTTTGKGARMEAVGAAASSGVAAALGPVEEAERRLTEILDAQKQGLAAIEAELKQKSAELDALRESIAGSLSPVKWFALELKDVAPQFTLLLGFVLAFAVAWPAARLAELTAIARASLRLDRDSPAAFWLAARRARATPLGPTMGAVALGIALVAWIALAAWQLSGTGAVVQAGLAMASVVAACAYHAWVQRDLAHLVAAATAPGATAMHPPL
jgi:hypothetical protein